MDWHSSELPVLHQVATAVSVTTTNVLVYTQRKYRGACKKCGSIYGILPTLLSLKEAAWVSLQQQEG